jgi:methionyl-tRNA formyltransferase
MKAQKIFPSKSKIKFVLLGGGYHICSFSSMLMKNGFLPPVIITWPKKLHERDRLMLKDSDSYLYIFDTIEKYGLEFIETNDVNSKKILDELSFFGCNTAFSMSWRTFIKNTFIDYFEGRVLNLHPTILPKERGAAAYSWRILNGSNEISSTIHLIEKKFDTGKIILQMEDELKIKLPRPIDFIKSTNKIYDLIMSELIDLIEINKPINLGQQNEMNNTYLQRLHTETNGAINWEWEINEIEKFIRAFSDPYPGAFTFVRDQKITILKAEIKNTESYHPLGYGKVLAKFDNGFVDIMCNGGTLNLKTVKLEGVINHSKPSDLLRNSDTLFTPNDVLQNAKITSIKPANM